MANTLTQRNAPASVLAPRPFSVLARDPFRNFESMRQWMDAMFGDDGGPSLAAAVEPAVNVYEKDGAYIVECALPGYKKDDIKVEARGDQVLITGTYSEEKTEDKNRYHRREMRQGSFARTIDLPQEIDPERVTAKLENGVLQLTLHPTTAVKSKSIPIA